MRIQVKSDRIPESALQVKLAILASLVSLLKDLDMFIPEEIHALEDGFSEADGKLVRSRTEITEWGAAGLRNYIMGLVNNNLLRPSRAVVRIDGNIKINGNIYPAYLAVYGNPTLSRIYGDIELDVWSSSRVESIAELFYEFPDFRRKINIISSRILGEMSSKIKYIVVGLSPDSSWNVLEWAYFYSRDKKLIIKNIFRTVRYLAESEDYTGEYRDLRILAKFLKPYKEDFFASTLLDIREFPQRLRTMAHEAGAEIEFTRSVTYIASRPDSSRRFFHNFKVTILDPLKDFLVNEERIRAELRRIVTRTARLT